MSLRTLAGLLRRPSSLVSARARTASQAAMLNAPARTSSRDSRASTKPSPFTSSCANSAPRSNPARESPHQIEMRSCILLLQTHGPERVALVLVCVHGDELERLLLVRAHHLARPSRSYTAKKKHSAQASRMRRVAAGPAPAAGLCTACNRTWCTSLACACIHLRTAAGIHGCTQVTIC